MPLAFGPHADAEKLKEFEDDVVPGTLKQFEDILKKNKEGKEWAAGDTFSFADLVLFNISDMILDQVS